MRKLTIPLIRLRVRTASDVPYDIHNLLVISVISCVPNKQEPARKPGSTSKITMRLKSLQLVL